MNDKQKRYTTLFLKHHTLWGAALFILWFGINVLVLASNRLFEFAREGKTIPFWEPLSWELSSQGMILILIPMGLYVYDRWIEKQQITHQLLFHIAASLVLSAIHIACMVGIRQLWYYWMNAHYVFGDWGTEFFYEYRKDAQTYLTLALVIFGYRFIVRRLQGEASYLAKDADNDITETESPPEHLLVKKLGREFLIQTADIEWIEASGNYANLHIKNTVYPMRITMDKLEKLLPPKFIRIHRSTIVNLEHIRDVQPLDAGDHQVTLHNQTLLTLSRRYRESFKLKVSFD
jgi:DNA-binding LytR/AlgR family response regulator